jgi:hypothetical protein
VLFAKALSIGILATRVLFAVMANDYPNF